MAAGNYSVVVSNYGGATMSSNALLAVRPLMSATLVQAGASLVINWSGPYTLQSATNLPGPYDDVMGATNPFTNLNALPQQFFRLRQ